MAIVRLIGSFTDGTGGGQANRLYLGKFKAVSTGVVDQIKVYSLANGEAKVAIYADSGGEPGARLGYNNTGQAVAASQWNTLSISPANIVKGMDYWIALVANVAIILTANTVYQGPRRYKTVTYSTFTFPDPAGTGFSSATGNELCLAGWGLAFDHAILDGQYATETPETNRAYVIGRDIYGNPVYGEAQDATELALVGERLDFQPDPAIPTTAQAADVAAAVLAKMRLTTKRGVILIPYNCGQELWDVVQITDAGANQAFVKFRVVGLRFEYHPKQARYHHKLILGAP
jgi:hypothetical protein